MRVYIYRQLLSEQFTSWYSQLYQTNAFSLNHHQDWFSDILSKLSEFETTDPDQADYFFVPLYVLPFQFLNADITSFIQQCTYLDRGKHLIFMSGDFGQRAKSAYESHHEGRAYRDLYTWLDDRFVLIALESTQDLLPGDIAILPYQIKFNSVITESKLIDARDASDVHGGAHLRGHRLLYSFCGAMSYPQLHQHHIRGEGGIKRKMGHGTDWFIGTPSQAVDLYGQDWGASRVMIARSIFTLCPAGFGRWTFRWIEALLSGSIPVILSDGYLMPFSECIDWNKYVITMPECQLDDVDDILRAIPIGDVFEFQENIYRDRHLFTRESCLQLFVNRLNFDLSHSR